MQPSICVRREEEKQRKRKQRIETG